MSEGPLCRLLVILMYVFMYICTVSIDVDELMESQKHSHSILFASFIYSIKLSVEYTALHSKF